MNSAAVSLIKHESDGGWGAEVTSGQWLTQQAQPSNCLHFNWRIILDFTLYYGSHRKKCFDFSQINTL